MRRDRRDYIADRIKFDFANDEPSLPVARIIWACVTLGCAFWVAVATRQQF